MKAEITPSNDPDLMVVKGVWLLETFTYGSGQSGQKSNYGRVYKAVTTGDYVCFMAENGKIFRAGDCVYIDSQRPDLPFFIALILGFRMTKKEQLFVELKYFYRTSDVSEEVYQDLIQDRLADKMNNGGENNIEWSLALREVFISDAQDSLPIHLLRGKCFVQQCKDIIGAYREFDAREDHFFYVLSFHPESNTLANIQGGIRVGPAHQAKVPDYLGQYDKETDEKRVWETLTWSPNRLADTDLMMYLRASRSMAAFAGICEGGSTEDGCWAAAKDTTTISALKALHNAQYDCGKALESLVSCPIPQALMNRWEEEDIKKFTKGLKLYGKNFFRIRKEMFPDRTVAACIEHYYLWKKTAPASSRPRQRVRRPQTTMRRVKPAVRPSQPMSTEFQDLSSASENECDSDDSDAKDLTGYACQHCSTTNSRDWHHAGKDRSLLCTECRLYFKKYGELRLLAADKSDSLPEFLFKPVREEVEINLESDDRKSFIDGSRERRSNARQLLLISNGPMSDITMVRASPDEVSTSSSGSLNDGTGKITAAFAVEFSSKSATDSEDGSGSEAEDRLRIPSEIVLSTNEAVKDAKQNTAESTLKERDVERFTSLCIPSAKETGVIVKTEQSNNDCHTDSPLSNPVLACPRVSSINSSASLPGLSYSRDSAISVQLESSNVDTIKSVAPAQFLPSGLEGTEESISIAKDPEPKIDDTESHRSKNAIFRRHWYRGEGNSCSRTDLVFIPIPGSSMARRREEIRQRVEFNKRNPEAERSTQLPRCASEQLTPLHSTSPQVSFSSSMIASTQLPQFGGPTGTFHPDLPALSRLREYANAASSSPGLSGLQSAAMVDPTLRLQILSGMFGPQEKHRLERYQDELMRRDVELSRGFASSDLSRHDDSLLGFRRRLGSSALSTGSNCGDLQDSQSSLDKKSAGDQHSLPSVSQSPKPGLTASSSKAAVAPSPPNEPCVSGMRQSQPRSGREVSMSRNGPGGVGVSQLRNSYDEAMLMESMQQSYANSRRNELASQPDYFALNNPFVLAQMESAAAAGMFFDPVYQQHQQLMMAAAQQAHMQQEHMRHRQQLALMQQTLVGGSMEAAMRDSFNRAMMESSLQHYRGNSTASDPSSQGFKAPGIPPYVGFASPFGLGAQEQHQGRSDSLLYPRLQSGNVNFSPKGSEGRH